MTKDNANRKRRAGIRMTRVATLVNAGVHLHLAQCTSVCRGWV